MKALFVLLAVLAVVTASGLTQKAEARNCDHAACPTVTLSASNVQAGEFFTISGSGFARNTVGTLSFSAFGQVYYSRPAGFLKDGTHTESVYFSGCSTAGTSYILITLTDGRGGTASATITLC